MTQVDFYVLDQTNPQSRLEFVCRLVGKILSLNQTVTILVEDDHRAGEMDQLLWFHPPESFVPHSIIKDDTDHDANNQDDFNRDVINQNDNSGGRAPVEADAVTISLGATVQKVDSVCINLRPQAPANHAVLPRLVEIVCQDPMVLASTREKYKFYRQLDYPLQSHPIHSNSL